MNKIYTVNFLSSDNMKKQTEVVAESPEKALEIAKENYRGYKSFKVLKRTKPTI